MQNKVQPTLLFPDEHVQSIVSFLDSRSRCEFFKYVLQQKGIESTYLWTLACLDLFSRKQHREVVVFMDLLALVDQADRHWCPIYPSPGTTRYGDDLSMAEYDKRPLDSPEQYEFYCRLRYNGRDVTSYVPKAEFIPGFVYLPMNRMFDDCLLWSSFKRYHDKIIYELERDGSLQHPLSSYVLGEFHRDAPLPLGFVATAVCRQKDDSPDHPLVACMGTITEDMADALDDLQDEQETLVRRASACASPPMLLRLLHVEYSDDHYFPDIALVFDSTHILGICFMESGT